MAKIAPILLVLNLNCLLQAEALAASSSADDSKVPAKDLRWPQRQVKVLVDQRSLSESERRVVAALLDQLEHRTCLKLERLPADQVNPFALLSSQSLAPSSADPNYNNFIYIFKAQFGRHHSSPSIGLSSLGCLGQGRQSIILTDSAFRWPRPILTYHLLRSLGVANLTRPDAPSPKSFRLPASARIGGPLDLAADIEPYLAYAEAPAGASTPVSNDYLSELDLANVKALYNCSEYQSRLSLLRPAIPEAAGSTLKPDQDPVITPSDPQPPDSQLGDAAEAEPSFPESRCRPLESCPLSGADERAPRLEKEAEEQLRPMILKLDSFHAQDPQLQLANQMKLSLVPGENQEAAESFRLLEAPPTGANQLPAQPKPAGRQQEMMISFEQTGTNASSNPIAALASSQLLKLCSCTCQTMSPSLATISTSTSAVTVQTPTTTPMASTEPTSQTRTNEPEETSGWPVTQLPPTASPTSTKAPPTQPTIKDTTTSETTMAPTTLEPTTGNPLTLAPTTRPDSTETPPTSSPPPPPPPTTQTEIGTSSTPKSTRSERPPASSESATTAPAITSPPPESSSQPPPPEGYCGQVEWVKPNKTVYGSARIVWDVDRANQNYFLCQNVVNGELVPGKTHGLACKVSSEGKAYELHNFQVLTKPEQVSLAWVQRNNSAFGKQNLPVVGGYSKLDGDPYLVSRCLVRDENNDVITLIGYVNGQGQGWYPFDDIQIECSQYDVLACI